MENPQQLFQTILAAYKRRLLTRTGLAALLMLACFAAALWRLHERGVGVSWLVGAGLGGLGLLGVWQWFVIRRDWISAQQAALKLDRALGLKARLLTAVEFANTPEPPALYPALLKETTQSLPLVTQHLPRVADRWTVALVAALVLLLLWPRLHSSSSLQRLAMRLPTTPPPSEPPPQPPPPPPQPQQSSQDQRRQQQNLQSQQGSGASAPQQAGGGGASASSAQSGQQSGRGAESSASSQGGSEQSAGAGGQSQPSQSGAGQGSHGSAEATAGAQGNPQQSQAASGLPQPSPTTQQAQAERSAQPDQSTSQRQAASAQTAAQQPSGGSQQQARASKDQAEQGTPQPSRDSQGSKEQASKAASARSTDDSTGREGASQQASAKSGGSSGGDKANKALAQLAKTAGASPGSAGEQELLKVDIQQLLKELSGELQDLQEQLARQHPELSNPRPGTTTDPQLYGDAASLERAAGSPLSLQLDVDQQASSTKRRGGGVGKPSGHVADATPQLKPEEAALADQAAEETGVRRQAIPPEYQPVFERLSHTRERNP